VHAQLQVGQRSVLTTTQGTLRRPPASLAPSARLLYDGRVPAPDPHVALVAKLNTKEPASPLAYLGAHVFGDAKVHRYQLNNGLTVLLLRDRSAPVAAYHTWFNVGSRHEKKGKTGLAHLFEHLMFNETESFKAGEFDKKLEENGAESNAATWVDWTFYHEALPKDRLPLAVKLESERMSRLVLREPQVKSEKEVVANERRYRVDDDVEGASSELLYKTAFTRHPYHWPTIGWMEDIQGFTPEDCESFYRTYYAPNNAVVVVVGDFQEERLLALMQKAYGGIARSLIPPDDAEPEPPQLDVREVTIQKPTPTDKLIVGYHGPALGDADHVSLTVLNEVLFGGRASRLYRALVIDTETCIETRGWVSTFKDEGLYEMYGTAREGKTTGDILAILDREIQRATDEVVTDDELARAKAKLELSLLQSLETMNGKAEQIGFFETVLGDPAAAFRKLDGYRRATASDLRKAARRYLAGRGRTLIRVLPEKSA
jgi:zinc protease